MDQEATDEDALVEAAESDPTAVTAAEARAAFDPSSVNQYTYAGALQTIGEADSDHLAALLDELAPLYTEPGEERPPFITTIGHVGAEHGELVATTVPALVDALDADNGLTVTKAVQALRAIGSGEGELLADHVEAFLPFLDDDHDVDRQLAAVNAVADVAKAEPGAVAPHTGALVAFVARGRAEIDQEALHQIDEASAREEYAERARETASKRQNNREMAALALVEVAKSHPGALVDHADTVAETLSEEPNGTVEAALVDVLAGVADGHPDEVAPFVDVLAAELDAEAPLVRGKATWALAMLGETHSEPVVAAAKPHLDRVVEQLGGEPRARSAAATLLSFVAEAGHDLPEGAVGDLFDCLDHDAAFVRGSAVWALAAVGGDEAERRLRETANADSEPDVRESARAALDELGASD